jgi:ATP-dependent DNA helicase RecG
MLTAAELLQLLGDLESDRIERTISTTDTDKFGAAVCAFANDFPSHRQPGYLMIGVRNDGTLDGLVVTDQLLLNLAGLRSDGNIQPLPAISVDRFKFAAGDVAVVEVMPSDLPPVRYRGRVYIRTGPRKSIANEQEERLLSERRISFARSFDALPCMEAKIGDLALSQFEAYRQEAVAADVIQQNQRSIEEQLSSLRFFDLQRQCPTNAGILLAGKNPRFFLPGDYIQYLRLPAIALVDMPLDQAEISGDLLTVLREMETRTRALITTKLQQLSTLRQSLRPDYPEPALRELLMNAVVHRNYESNTPIRFYWFANRIEIQSPGGLYGEVTPQNYLRQNSYRNPVLAEAMKALGYVNRYGYGIRRAQQLLEENGNPPAEFTFEPQAVLVVIYRRPE